MDGAAAYRDEAGRYLLGLRLVAPEAAAAFEWRLLPVHRSDGMLFAAMPSFWSKGPGAA